MTRHAAPILLIALAACGQRIIPKTTPIPDAPPEAVETSLFLIGDAGKPHKDEPVLAALRGLIARDSARSLVLFLGDNIYPRGLPAPTSADYDSATIRLDAQIAVLTSTGVPGYFVPGNHDWDRFGDSGWASIRRQEARIAQVGGSLVQLLPKGGCPGPVVVDVKSRLRLILLDSQWWLQGGPKPHTAADGCEFYTPAMVEKALHDSVASAAGREVIVAAHHPLSSGGEHGGFFDWKDHLFPLHNVKSWLWIPLPGLGSIYPVARGLGISSQDIPSKKYGAMIKAFSRAFQGQKPLAFAAGHEHGLQLIQGGPVQWQLVSGAGISEHEGPLVAIDGTLLGLQEPGFMRIDVLGDGRVRLGVIIVDAAGKPTEIHSRWLGRDGSY